MKSRLTLRTLYALAGALAFLAMASVFLLAIGRPPLTTLATMVVYAFGDDYSTSESLVKATPILLCALAVILPARLGLITVGGEGQLYFGALFGTAVVVNYPESADVYSAADNAVARGGGRSGLERHRWRPPRTFQCE
jgi:general nucleoside transport system permease protein